VVRLRAVIQSRADRLRYFLHESADRVLLAQIEAYIEAYEDAAAKVEELLTRYGPDAKATPNRGTGNTG
jgi:hypothetical protein